MTTKIKPHWVARPSDWWSKLAFLVEFEDEAARQLEDDEARDRATIAAELDRFEAGRDR